MRFIKFQLVRERVFICFSNASTEDASFEDVVKITFRLPAEREAALLKELTELSNGTVEAHRRGEKYGTFSV